MLAIVDSLWRFQAFSCGENGAKDWILPTSGQHQEPINRWSRSRLPLIVLHGGLLAKCNNRIGHSAKSIQPPVQYTLWLENEKQYFYWWVSFSFAIWARISMKLPSLAQITRDEWLHKLNFSRFSVSDCISAVRVLQYPTWHSSFDWIPSTETSVHHRNAKNVKG